LVFIVHDFLAPHQGNPAQEHEFLWGNGGSNMTHAKIKVTGTVLMPHNIFRAEVTRMLLWPKKISLIYTYKCKFLKQLDLMVINCMKWLTVKVSKLFMNNIKNNWTFYITFITYVTKIVIIYWIGYIFTTQLYLQDKELHLISFCLLSIYWIIEWI
jgi:hypothetical protein